MSQTLSYQGRKGKAAALLISAILSLKATAATIFLFDNNIHLFSTEWKIQLVWDSSAYACAGGVVSRLEQCRVW